MIIIVHEPEPRRHTYRVYSDLPIEERDVEVFRICGDTTERRKTQQEATNAINSILGMKEVFSYWEE